jgi:uncharacterized protein (DUF697 family)
MARKKTPDVIGEVLGGKVPEEGRQTRDTSVAPKAGSSVSPRSEVARPDGRDDAVTKIISKYAVWAAGIGLIPLPVVDVIALSGLQVKMLSVLARTYGVDFSENAGRSMIASLSSSVSAESLGRGVLGSVLKSIPLVGWVAGWLIMPAAAGALTYAVGRVFAQHFESGGSFLDFDAQEFKEAFREQYRKGLAFVRRKQNDD